METAEEAETTEPHPFLALILARMESNPDEFGADNSPWRTLIEQSKQYLTPEEKKALKAAEREAGLGHLHKRAMKKLLGDTAVPAGINKYTTTAVLSRPPIFATGETYDSVLSKIMERVDALNPGE